MDSKCFDATGDITRVNENVTNPRTPTGELFAARSGMAAGVTGGTGSFCSVEWEFNHAAGQTEQSVAVSTVISLT